MTEQIHKDLSLLASVIETLPGNVQTALGPALNQLNTVMNHRKKTLELVQEAMGQVRLDVNYMVFDLEATRRERDELKQRLGE